MIRAFEGHLPAVPQSAFVADSADVIGRVTLGEQASIWFQTVVRGDVHWIRIGDRSNIQDNCVIHVTTDTHPTVIENDVTVGHSVTLHGCTLRAGCLIGMGSIVMDLAEIGEGALIAAGSLVTPRTIIPPHTLAVGRPCVPKRLLREEEREHLALHAKRYVELSRRYRAEDGNE